MTTVPAGMAPAGAEEELRLARAALLAGSVQPEYPVTRHRGTSPAVPGIIAMGTPEWHLIIRMTAALHDNPQGGSEIFTDHNGTTIVLDAGGMITTWETGEAAA